MSVDNQIVWLNTQDCRIVLVLVKEGRDIKMEVVRVGDMMVLVRGEHVFRTCGDNGNIRIASRISYAMMAPVTISIILPALWFRGNNSSQQYKFEYNVQRSLVQLLDHPPDQPGSHFGSDVIAFGDAAQDIQIFNMHYPKAVVVSYQIRMTLERLDDESGKLMAEFPRSSTNQKCARGLCVPAGRLIFDYMRNLVEASRLPEAYAYMPGRLIYDYIAHMEKFTTPTVLPYHQ
ncbi:hypothetical protein FB45DRAFT_867475 [Roridomyces roridus]|uniref:Uncharacterized protein n=1 Tax=Roridomyces roridus TaxID=1738132 RepID=A0AAD7BR14_9AGAR|nr:hypothetical protein FB45DRAFT_867475 [Roridomyces roridus]